MSTGREAPEMGNSKALDSGAALYGYRQGILDQPQKPWAEDDSSIKLILIR